MRERIIFLCVLLPFLAIMVTGGILVTRHKTQLPESYASTPINQNTGTVSQEPGPVVTLVAKYYRRVPLAPLAPEDLDTAILAQGAIVIGSREPNEPANPQVLQDLVLSGRLFVVDAFTKARLLPETSSATYTGPLVKAEIIDGPFRGRTGWIEKGWARAER